MLIKRLLVAATLLLSGILYAADDNSYILDNGKVRACFAGGDSFRDKELCLELSGLTAKEARH